MAAGVGLVAEPVWDRLPRLGAWGVNHILVGALMFVFGVAFTFGAATAVQSWHQAHQPPQDNGPVIDQALLRPAFDYRKRLSSRGDCEPTTPWPEPANTSALRQY
jgi:hypothetical protein